MTPVSDIDYTTWLTKDQAAAAIGVTTKTVERFVQAGQIHQARWQPGGRGPLRVVYQPDDVAKLAAAKRQGPLPPFLVLGPPAAPPPNGNGQGTVGLAHIESTPDPSRIQLGSGEHLLHALVGAAVKVMSETSQTSALFLSIPEAAAYTGLTQAFLKRMIKLGTLTAIKDRCWKIRRKDLEGF